MRLTCLPRLPLQGVISTAITKVHNLSSSNYKVELGQVVQQGVLDSSARSTYNNQSAYFWADGAGACRVGFTSEQGLWACTHVNVHDKAVLSVWVCMHCMCGGVPAEVLHRCA